MARTRRWCDAELQQPEAHPASSLPQQATAACWPATCCRSISAADGASYSSVAQPVQGSRAVPLTQSSGGAAMRAMEQCRQQQWKCQQLWQQC